MLSVSEIQTKPEVAIQPALLQTKTASTSFGSNPFRRRVGDRRSVPDVVSLARYGTLRFDDLRTDPYHWSALVSTTVAAAENMPPTPCTTESFAPAICAGEMPRICRTDSCSANIPYIPECM